MIMINPMKLIAAAALSIIILGVSGVSGAAQREDYPLCDDPLPCKPHPHPHPHPYPGPTYPILI